MSQGWLARSGRPRSCAFSVALREVPQVVDRVLLDEPGDRHESPSEEPTASSLSMMLSQVEHFDFPVEKYHLAKVGVGKQLGNKANDRAQIGKQRACSKGTRVHKKWAAFSYDKKSARRRWQG